MSRPPKPAMTRLEYESTKHLGSREASWEISTNRGAHKDPDRLVSRVWVSQWRQAWKSIGAESDESAMKAWQEMALGKKLQKAGRNVPIQRLARNVLCRAIRDPVPHQEASANPETIANSPGVNTPKAAKSEPFALEAENGGKAR